MQFAQWWNLHKVSEYILDILFCMCVEVGISEGYNRKKLGPEDKPFCCSFVKPVNKPDGLCVYIRVARAILELVTIPILLRGFKRSWCFE